MFLGVWNTKKHLKLQYVDCTEKWAEPSPCHWLVPIQSPRAAAASKGSNTFWNRKVPHLVVWAIPCPQIYGLFPPSLSDQIRQIEHWSWFYFLFCHFRSVCNNVNLWLLPIFWQLHHSLCATGSLVAKLQNAVFFGTSVWTTFVKKRMLRPEKKSKQTEEPEAYDLQWATAADFLQQLPERAAVGTTAECRQALFKLSAFVCQIPLHPL